MSAPADGGDLPRDPLMPDTDHPPSVDGATCYVIRRDGEEIGTVRTVGDLVEATTPEGTERHRSLADALERHPTLVTVDRAGEWSIETILPAWRVAERVVGEADEVTLNDTTWYPGLESSIPWVPEDSFPHPSTVPGSVSISVKLPGAGSPGGSPSCASGAHRVGDSDLWGLWDTEEFDFGPRWFRASEALEALEHVLGVFTGQGNRNHVTQIDCPALSSNGHRRVADLLGHLSEDGWGNLWENSWRTIWVNDALWHWVGDRWVPPDPELPAWPAPPLDRPVELFVEIPFSDASDWTRHRVGPGTRAPRRGRSLKIIVLPPAASDRDLLTLFHGDATSSFAEVWEQSYAVVRTEAGSEWLGIVWPSARLAEVVGQVLPDARALWWDNGERMRANGSDGKLRWWSLDAEASELPAAAQRLVELDPLGDGWFC